jgi:hypothetical protein
MSSRGGGRSELCQTVGRGGVVEDGKNYGQKMTSRDGGRSEFCQTERSRGRQARSTEDELARWGTF